METQIGEHTIESLMENCAPAIGRDTPHREGAYEYLQMITWSIFDHLIKDALSTGNMHFAECTLKYMVIVFTEDDTYYYATCKPAIPPEVVKPNEVIKKIPGIIIKTHKTIRELVSSKGATPKLEMENL